MFFGNTIDDTRQLFYTAWRKYRLTQPLSALEQQLADVIIDHPEYHSLLEQKEGNNSQAWFPEMGQTNPFLHMGLHLAIRDQLATDRPPGVIAQYQQLMIKYHDALAVEHIMMEALAECLWQAQRNQSAPDEQAYLHALSQVSGRLPL